MTTSKTSKLLIVNTFLLVLILALLLFGNFGKFKSYLGYPISDSEETLDLSDEAEQEHYYPKQEPLQVDFAGLKNDTIPLPVQIMELITEQLEGYNWNDEFEEKDLYSIRHETIFATQFPSKTAPFKKWIVLTFSNYGSNYYHAATGRISLFEFQKERHLWQLTKYFAAFGYGNEYGEVPLGCALVRIGNNDKYAVIIHTSYSGNSGHEMETKSVYAEVDKSFEPVLDFTCYEYYNDPPQNSSYIEGHFDMRIIPDDKPWFDIETKREGTKWNDQTPGAVKRFEFNGVEYAEIENEGLKNN